MPVLRLSTLCPSRAVLPAALAAAVLLWSRGGPAGGQTPSVQIAGATASAPLDLALGCNLVVAESVTGTPVAAIAALVRPREAIVSIWRYDNTAKVFRVGFFANAGAPVDFTTTGSGPAGQAAEAYYVCLSRPATIGPATS